MCGNVKMLYKRQRLGSLAVLIGSQTVPAYEQHSSNRLGNSRLSGSWERKRCSTHREISGKLILVLTSGQDAQILNREVHALKGKPRLVREGLVQRKACHLPGNSLSKCKVGQSDELTKNDPIPVTSFLRIGNFGGPGVCFGNPLCVFQYSHNFEELGYFSLLFFPLES